MRTPVSYSKPVAAVPAGCPLPGVRPEAVRPGRSALLAIVVLSLFGACDKDAEFRHEGHLTITRGACSPCHGKDPSAPRPATVADCTACHRQAKGLTPELAARYAAGRRTDQDSRPPGYADVVFSHKRHAAAGAACRTCHFPAVKTRKSVGFPGASSCYGCHAKEGVSRECRTCHRKGGKGNRPLSHLSR